MSEDPLSRGEGRELRDAIRELTHEFRAFRNEATQTFVRRDTHNLDLQLKSSSHNKDIELLTQTLTALQENTRAQLKTQALRLDKIESDGDWLKKIIYATIIVAVLATFGISSAATAGVFK